MALPLGCQTNHLVEVVATYHGVPLAKKINAKAVWLEGDSNNIIQCLFSKHKPSWNIKCWIEKERDLLKSFQNHNISHAYREANGLADYFAKLGVSTNDEKVWGLGDNISAEIKAFMLYDLAQGRHILNDKKYPLLMARILFK